MHCCKNCGGTSVKPVVGEDEGLKIHRCGCGRIYYSLLLDEDNVEVPYESFI